MSLRVCLCVCVFVYLYAYVCVRVFLTIGDETVRAFAFAVCMSRGNWNNDVRDYSCNKIKFMLNR